MKTLFDNCCIPLEIPMPGLFGTVNCFLLKTSAGAALIDTGVNAPFAYDALEAGCRKHGLSVSDIQTVFCTHCHPDHCGLAARLQRHGARIVMGSIEAAGLRTYFATSDHDRERASFYGEHVVDEQIVAGVVDVFSGLRRAHAAFEPDVLVDDGDEVSLAGITFTAIHTPGHTNGHTCLLLEDENILFVGDHLLDDSTVHIALPPEMDTEDPLGAYLNSLIGISELPVSRACTGHGPPVSDLKARCGRIQNIYQERCEAVLKGVEPRPLGLSAITEVAFKKKRRSLAQWFAASLTLACLQNLVARGLVESSVRDGRWLYTLNTSL